MEDEYLTSAAREFRYYKSLGDKTLQRLSLQQLTWKANEQTNSIAVIVHHMYGNMLSRFTGFLTEDGEKTWRNRDAEFVDGEVTKESVLLQWEQGWQSVLACIEGLTAADISKTVYIRSEPHSVIAAVNRQIAHYGYHVGQIVLIAKMLLPQWESLSIPLHQSDVFNQQMRERHADQGN